ncbi:hypothetical protein QE374_002795 [Microbacterium sp. SORGH_AS428]|uniref:hypothetical protein n=1 Tax=Microbacterium sp. SORGH_AS_0428 TaxID=3041788 RepID=UPI00285FAF3D|nr:hypothetical protein [Microbacterium sp. SORGH_AS_0428]MDR6200886.1 hypothetical protein [Microbacterium sp. SORGH_AS_0428]
MTDHDGEWLGEASSADTALLEHAPGGALSSRGRQAAIEASLGLLGVYFAAGDQQLVDRASGSRAEQPDELDVILAGLRVRVALAASNRLLKILSDVVARPTFRYELRSTEQVGALSGALDINRWVTRSHGGDQELTYPVLEVRRGARTPENVLASYALAWIREELRRSLAVSIATSGSVEYRAVRQQRERLGRLAQLPLLAGSAPRATEIRTRPALDRLMAQVQRRLQRREIPSARPYSELVEWMSACLSGLPAVDPGDVDLALYGHQFDNKLFELWCLGTLGRELAHAMNVPEPIINRAWRREAAAYSFENFSGRIDVYFQRSIPSVTKLSAARWVKEDGRPLGGIPDIVVRARPLGGTERLAVLDPKLRQRDRLPAEELYKILGYLQNFGIEPAVGGVLIYTTEAEPRPADVFHDDAGGTLISASLNPSASPDVVKDALRDVVTTLLSQIDLVPPTSTAASDALGSAQELAEDTVESTRTLLASWGNAHLGEIRPSRERIEALVGEKRWAALASDVQVMMATADLVGHQLDPTADFSGPVIGMCAAIEHLIYTQLIQSVVAGNTDWARQTRTFGAAVDAVGLAARGKGSTISKSIRARMELLGLDLDVVASLESSWHRLNSTYRVPAAHREVLSRTSWQQVYRLVIGAETLFARTYDALQSTSPNSS